jgi:hypothetical protein
VAQLLLDKGADVHAENGYHGNALQAAPTGCWCNFVPATAI